MNIYLKLKKKIGLVGCSGWVDQVEKFSTRLLNRQWSGWGFLTQPKCAIWVELSGLARQPNPLLTPKGKLVNEDTTLGTTIETPKRGHEC